MAKPAPKFGVGQEVIVSTGGRGEVEDCRITYIVGWWKKQWMYQVEYHIVGDPPDRRHSQPWVEKEIQPVRKELHS